MNYCAKHGILCENANAYGNCSITACSEYIKLQIQKIYSVDKVIYSKYAGTEVKLEDEELIVVKQNDILAVVTD